jgi:hypothetical protein
MTQFFNDLFTGSSGVLTGHTSNSGHSWTKVAGSATPTLDGSGKLQPQGTAHMRAEIDAPSADYSVTAIIQNHGTFDGSVSDSGPCIRFQSAADTFYGLSYFPPNATWYLKRVVAGAETVLTTDGGAHSITDHDTDHTVVLTVSGTNPVALSATLDGTTLFTYNDSDAARITSAGRPGLVSNTATSYETYGVNFNALSADYAGGGGGSAPTITSCTPADGFVNSTQTVVIAGTNFSGATGVSVDGTNVSVSSFNVDSSTQITAVIVNGSSASATARTLTVTTPDGTATVTYTVKSRSGGGSIPPSIRFGGGKGRLLTLTLSKA